MDERTNGSLRRGLPKASSGVGGWSLGMEVWGPMWTLLPIPTPSSEDATSTYFPEPCMHVCSAALGLTESETP